VQVYSCFGVLVVIAIASQVAMHVLLRNSYIKSGSDWELHCERAGISSYASEFRTAVRSQLVHLTC
jgi:hypothetical protein